MYGRRTPATTVNDMMAGACLSPQLNPLMCQGQIEALEHHASDAIKRLILLQTDFPVNVILEP
jgi:hypothetical protein